MTNTLKHSGFLIIDEFHLNNWPVEGHANNWMLDPYGDIKHLRSAAISLHGDDRQLKPFLGVGKISMSTFLDGKKVLLNEFHTDNLPWISRRKGEGRYPGAFNGKHRGGKL